MSNFLPGIMDGFVLASRIAACCSRKHPTGDSGIHPNSTTVVHEGQFSEAIEDDVEVMLEEVYEHLDTGTLPDGLADVNGGLQLSWNAAEEDNAESIGEFTVAVGSEVGSGELGWGKQLKQLAQPLYSTQSA
ncbi:uncharacterized protein EI90DRAFT_3132162 [Cantharellus anzutake]|uniref:uncharacterized protein n=1 Tax=Cantharellus anzutake TaxID=1750568 RepID=UPI001908D9CF|nr:uncharacterized protein EI90DRAFT_3132162 [Cantharellus anzutake]KAF8320180.1 hypothetical protein EI90DRAFT_3132162 [Cantharellus anzutake]